MFENNLEKAEAVLGLVKGAADKSFRKALNRGERRFEFMGDVGDEITADAFELAQLGDIVQHDDSAGSIRGADGCNSDSKVVLAQRASDDFGFNAGLAFYDSATR